MARPSSDRVRPDLYTHFLYENGPLTCNPGSHQVLTPGTSHVAVGFVDLGDLASACLLLKGADLKAKPLRYFAITFTVSHGQHPWDDDWQHQHF